MKQAILFLCFATFITLNVDRYGNWCKGNLTTKEKASFVLQNMINTAPTEKARYKLIGKLYDVKFKQKYNLSKKNDILNIRGI